MQKPKYEAVIELIRKGDISVGTHSGQINLPDQYKHLACTVLGNEDTNGVLTVGYVSRLKSILDEQPFY